MSWERAQTYAYPVTEVKKSAFPNICLLKFLRKYPVLKCGLEIYLINMLLLLFDIQLYPEDYEPLAEEPRKQHRKKRYVTVGSRWHTDTVTYG